MNMTQSSQHIAPGKWMHILCGAALVISFFLPWVEWDGSKIAGYAFPAGDFFGISESRFKLANPFPQFSFSFYAFWLIPVLAALSSVFVFLKKKVIPFAFIAGALSLTLLTVFYLFTSTLTDLGVGKDVFGMLKPSAYIHALSAIGLVASAYPSKNIFPKIIWLLIGPVIAYSGYKLGEKYIMSETHTATEQVKADYIVDATELIKEFATNDTATNKKYLDKVLVVNGNISVVEILPDSTSTIQFADSTGSYAIFSLEKNQFDQVKSIKSGDAVSIKGVCSGSIFSKILGTTSISFKRSTLNKTK